MLWTVKRTLPVTQIVLSATRRQREKGANSGRGDEEAQPPLSLRRKSLAAGDTKSHCGRMVLEGLESLLESQMEQMMDSMIQMD